ncbi:MAG: class I SAM-dependent methyltransferase [Paracoccus sp. (in: a-proteobacteria)]|nr:class I SAM-dependent methyltransferase [Paracoccus sp. (in: a-proteobacteria)]
MNNGWDSSAAAWIADQGDEGDFSRKHVLDAPMKALIAGRGFRDALDLGCGEGRFCRIMSAMGLRVTGIDPTAALLAQARKLDPSGDYREGRAEALDLPENSFDLVVSYLTLIDIDDAHAALAETRRVLRPGGSLLIANLNSFATAGTRRADGTHQIRDYMTPRAEWQEWREIRVRNHHRPMQYYMQALLAHGLQLRHFSEPVPEPGAPPREAAHHLRFPFFHIMEWQVPA